jgi:hypothetical protein
VAGILMVCSPATVFAESLSSLGSFRETDRKSMQTTLLFPNENQNAGCQRKDGHDNAKAETNQSHQAAEDQIDSEQEHSGFW